MTFTFKLARRLALSPAVVMLLALPSLAACGADQFGASEISDPAAARPDKNGKPPRRKHLTGLEITPATASVTSGGTVQFTATGQYADGSTRPVSASWAASGGAISGSGLYTAGPAGTHRVVASAGGHADTAVVTVAATEPPPPPPTGGLANECATPDPAWIWCDDFDQDRLARYFEYQSAGGSFVRAANVGVGGSYGMRARFAQGQVSAGALHLAFGRTPQSYFRPADDGTRDHREVYWRVYLRNEPAWSGGGGYKLSRATSFASSSSWAQAMIAHVWSGSSSSVWNHLYIDPASGTDLAGNLQTTTYNDFDRLRWLGAVRGATPVFDASHVGTWHCIEARARLNDPGEANAEFELWVDGARDALKTGFNWVGAFDDYGINAVFLENYWNGGSPKAQERYFDNFVVSTARIGC